ncbi:MAG TPA: cbb3-type cytochrome oxidase assembly protein CcoS [Pseudomonadales bacterium]
MESLYILIPVAGVFCLIAIKLFVWAIDNRQFDDLERESRRILEDDDDV